MDREIVANVIIRKLGFGCSEQIVILVVCEQPLLDRYMLCLGQAAEQVPNEYLFFF
jgi:hypothetical protein